MKRILVFSDTHGDTERCVRIIDNMENRVDMIIHAGDNVRDAEHLQSLYPDIPIHYVCGNCDMFSNAPSKLLLSIGNISVFLTHGHEYSVKYESKYSTLVKKASSLNCDLCIFGHTHIPYTDYVGKMTVLNPGSLRFGGTYAVVEIENKTVKTAILDS